ncbi:sulfatase-like hydrolase/transferase [uncultured Fibrobacter sp.]|uniref:LTA synthase family protein n=1 Tax=uncultured Fibrobacter sp. TaxID=261512 RepID=UPI002632427E|nr:sulfatase-like hydrolase/transferase [uncultured Fibrobacter sp.]
MKKDATNNDFSHTNFFFWFIFGLILIAGRFALLCSLYMLDTPTGTSLVPDYNRFLWHTLYEEIGFGMALSLIFFTISRFVREKGLKFVKIAAVICAAIYLTLSGTDDEIQRWMSQKLSISFIKTYCNAWNDMGLVSKIALGGIQHFLLTVGLVILTVTGLSIFSYKHDIRGIWQRPIQKKTWITLGMMIVFAALGCTSHLWYNYSQHRWDRIRPVVYTLVGDVIEEFESKEEPPDYAEGIRLMGGNPDKEYPFWKENPNEATSIETFKSKPLEEKPDILLMTIESLRGWTCDMRVESNCKLFPNLCRLSKQGLYFPNAYSVGNPSVEGLLGIMTGVNSHSTKTLLRDYPNTNLRAFSEVLSEAGYYNEVILGADPRFDNEEAWYTKWFDYHEFKPEYEDDVSSALRFVERYRMRPKDKPTFFHWMSLSMHTPFVLPAELGETPEDPGEAYLRATAYMDSAVGIILDSLATDPRFQNTLIILTGDHSTPNGKQQQESGRIGMGNEGYSWISIMMSGPNISPAIDKRIVSQANIAPSIMAYLGLEVSNHYMGINLFDDSLATKELPAVYSYKYGSMAMRSDSMSYYIFPVEGTDPAVAQKVLLDPTWDTTNPADGFVTGTPVELPKDSLNEIARKMRAIARAWNFVVHQNKVMPPR